MAKKKIDPKDNATNQKNKNKGTDGTNKQFDKVQENKNKQKQEQIHKKKEK